MSNSLAQPTTTVADALNYARRLTLSETDVAPWRQARAIIQVEPSIAEAHLILAAAHRALNEMEEARDAEQRAIQISQADPVLIRVAEYLAADQFTGAVRLLELFLKDTPNDPEDIAIVSATGQAKRRFGGAGASSRSLRSLHQPSVWLPG